MKMNLFGEEHEFSPSPSFFVRKNSWSMFQAYYKDDVLSISFDDVVFKLTKEEAKELGAFIQKVTNG